MNSARDAADYILKQLGPMPAMKLQKLLYYSQVWSLVWDEQPLFNAKIEAWANGPVVPQIYRDHRGKFKVGRGDFEGDWRKLSPRQRETINVVLEHYGSKSSQWLSDLTHAEKPWKDARGDLSPGERGTSEITQAAMAEYYGSL